MTTNQVDGAVAPVDTSWRVTFIGDYFALTTNITASGADEAIDNATENLMSFYGWDMKQLAHDAEAESSD